MPANINVTSHISLHTWSRRTKFFQNPVGRETTLAIRMTTKTLMKKHSCSLTFKVFQKHTFYLHKTFATTIAETAAPNCPRPYFAASITLLTTI